MAGLLALGASAAIMGLTAALIHGYDLVREKMGGIYK